ncbi:MAG: orotate phosphoribosyltransferase [Acidimicrobiaceae bacterium]
MGQVDAIRNADHAGHLVSLHHQQLLEIVKRPGVVMHLPSPVKLASGDESNVFIDGKLAVADPDDLARVGAAMFAAAEHENVELDAVGGLVLGAAPFTFAVAAAARLKWFLIRKEPKGRGTNRYIEGARIESGMRVMLVDDVVTKGSSIQLAYEHVVDVGGEVVFATTFVDRSGAAAAFFRERGVPYKPMLTYEDLGIPRVGGSSERAVAAG